jgi:cell division septal protein FtsQ
VYGGQRIYYPVGDSAESNEMQKRNVLSSPRLTELKKHRRRAVLNKILLALFGLVAIFILLAFISRLNILNISQIEISGNKVVDTEALKGMVQEQITGKYLWLFPKTNILFYPKNNITNALQDKFKRLNSINLSIKNKTLEISLSERIAQYTWCGNIPPQTNNEQQCYFMDENGYIFDEAPYFSGAVYFKFYGVQSKSYFFKQDFKQLIAFKDILIGFGFKPIALYITNNQDVEIFLSKGISSTSTIGPKIIFKIDADLQNVAENLEAALNTEPLKSKFKNKYSSLEYIDLRFGNKVYDKFLE